MPQCGGRRYGARTLLLAGLALACGVAGAAGSLMAIDLGSEYLKVCLVKPGRTPISVVVNEMSRRKSPALVGLLPDGERVLGEEAYSLAIRYPGSIFGGIRDLLGRSAGSAASTRAVALHGLRGTLEDHPSRRTAAVRVNETDAFLVEELVVRSIAAFRS